MTRTLPSVSNKTIVVLGAAYAGRRVAQTLSYFLPEGWTLVVIDRNSHFNRDVSPPSSDIHC
jgi:NADH dehydrogenase FAD-containing subunit